MVFIDIRSHTFRIVLSYRDDFDDSGNIHMKNIRTLFLMPPQHNMVKRCLALPHYLYFGLLIGLLISLPAHAQQNVPEAHKWDKEALLDISDELKYQLDTYIRPIQSPYKRAKKLHEFLFNQDQLNIVYDSRLTLSAHETFLKKSGNCLSLAALVTASARYVDLPATFQSVKVKKNWEKSQQFYIVPGHINVVIELANQSVFFEFIAAYQETSQDRSKNTIISDERFYAEFYNNLGVSQVEEGNINQAIELMSFSNDIYPKLSSTWSNLGVAQKLNNQRDLAEQSYRKAIRLNKRNLSPLSNLYILLNEDGRTKEANKIAKKVIRYSKKNPYFLAKLAQSDLRVKNHKLAQKHIKKAISKKPDEADFYHLLAQIYDKQGKKQEAINTLIDAGKRIKSKYENDRFDEKIKQMTAHLLSSN